MNWNGASLFLQKMLFMAKKTVNVVFFSYLCNRTFVCAEVVHFYHFCKRKYLVIRYL